MAIYQQESAKGEAGTGVRSGGAVAIFGTPQLLH